MIKRFIGIVAAAALMVSSAVWFGCSKEEEKEGIYNDYCCYGAIIMVLKGNK